MIKNDFNESEQNIINNQSINGFCDLRVSETSSFSQYYCKQHISLRQRRSI